MAWVGRSGSAEEAAAPPGPGQLGSLALGLQHLRVQLPEDRGLDLQDPSDPALSAVGVVPSTLCPEWVPEASERRLCRPGLGPPPPSL